MSVEQECFFEQMSLRRTLRWGDLISPREMWAFTLADAWGALPTLLAMAGFFLGAVLVIYLVKKGLEWLLLPSERFKKYVLEDTQDRNGQGQVMKVWRKMPISHYGSIAHLVLETLFFAGILISALFAAAVGNLNLWESPIASVGIGLIGTYILGPGLQQLGCGYFFFLCNAMAVGEYWILIGGGVEGRVTRISPFFVEMMSVDAAKHGRLHRVSMITVMTASWERSFFKEAHEPIVVMDMKNPVLMPPTHVGLHLLDEDLDGDGDDDDSLVYNQVDAGDIKKFR
jgi:hypothetical protein